MHDTAFRIGTLAMQAYADLEKASILEIGSQIVNGSLRHSALPTTDYVGIDIEEGDGVDIVSAPGEEWPVDDDRFDLVMASSVFEHDTAFWRTFLQMCRKTKAGGHIYISAPSNGKVHRYPQDYWRFYPDAGLALKALAESEGIQITLVESFVADREEAEWNDFCAIFRREPSSDPLPTSFIWQRVACTNALTWQSPEVHNEREGTEDQVLLWRERENVLQLQRVRESESSAWNAERESLARSAAEGKVAEERAKLLLEEARARSEDAERRLAQLDHEIQSRENRIADLESNLRQRQEEISQAWAQVEAERVAKDRLAEEIEARKVEIADLESKVRDADAWVFKLAGDRRHAEQISAHLESELSRERELLNWEQSRSGELSRKVDELGKAREQDEARLDKSHGQLSLMLGQLREREIELAERTAKLSIASDDLDRLHREAAALSKSLREQEGIGSQKVRQLEWMRRVEEVIAASTTGWRALMPPSWRRNRQLSALRKRGLFDSSGYLQRYPDVAEAGMDPLLHYILHGMQEGRQADISAG